MADKYAHCMPAICGYLGKSICRLKTNIFSVIFTRLMAGIAQLVERWFVVPNVAGSSPTTRPIFAGVV